ncbi:MAG: glycosyltransferase family 2 protein [Desulfobacteraceae bacterium]|nr:glycosyltransferase family 2 protein [Desulfobacteraceae bacterium]
MINNLQIFGKNLSTFFKSYKLINGLRNEIDTLKAKLDVPKDLYDRFYAERNSASYSSVFTKDEPLVTVCIATYNRGRLLVERSIASVLGQTYKNIELIVIGDCCSDDTAQLVGAIDDSRLRFYNLPERGNYPQNPLHSWYVAGTSPVNYALKLAQGDFITHLDDDDEFVVDRIEKLVSFIQREQADLVWHPFWYERNNGKWALKKSQEFAGGQLTTSSIFYHRWFASIPWDVEAYRYQEPGDWNRLRKFKYLGANMTRFPEPLLKHYLERNQRGR